MNRKTETVAEEGAEPGCVGAALHVQSAVIVESSRVVQLRNGTWDVVVRSAGKGTFLIRCRKDRLSGQCPFLGIEVRHIAVAGNHDQHDAAARGQEVGVQSGGLNPSVVPLFRQQQEV